jgi:Flp pilus assembly protein TadD
MKGPMRSRWIGAVPGLGVIALLLAAGCSKRPQLVAVPGAPASGAPHAPEPAPPQNQTREARHAALITQLISHLDHRPNDHVNRLLLANALYDVGRNTEAATHYRKYLEVHPDNANVRTDLGTCYKRLGQYDAAIGEYERTIAVAPGHFHAIYNAGVTNTLAGHRERARHFFKRLMDMDGNGKVGAMAAKRLRELDRPAGN